ncbi:hypothetical protein O988_02682 [Pseudogymnoascus sp. VKM F-3808]|nr:hypothetical protein O988_02682 [Pseudogymnoascus sp. VKM F-3808]
MNPPPNPGPTSQNYTDYVASLGRLEQENRTRFQNAGILLPAGPSYNPSPSYVLGGDGSAFPVPRNNPSIPASGPFGSSTANTPGSAVNRPVDSGRPLPGFYEAFSGVAPSLAGQTSPQFNGAPQPGQHRPGLGGRIGRMGEVGEGKEREGAVVGVCEYAVGMADGGLE